MKLSHKTYKQSTVVKRLLLYYEQSHDNERQFNWYANANKFAYDLSERYNVPILNVCGVIAALSPQKGWSENKKIAHEFLSGLERGHTRQQLKKARQCLLLDKEVEIFDSLSIGGKKTSHFFMNILQPTNENFVTIDRHAIGSCIFDYNKIIGQPPEQLTVSQYYFMVDCYKIAAKRKQILPNMLQSTIWQAYRRIKEVHEQYDRPKEDISCPF